MSPRAATAALALLAASCPPPAAAQTTWLCGLSADAVQLVCVAEADPVLAAHAAPAAATAVVHGTRFPLDPGGRWVVDLWSPPTDPDSLAQLARATICYRSPGCEVVLAWAPERWRTRVAAR